MKGPCDMHCNRRDRDRRARQRLATTRENLAHAEMTKKHSHIRYAEPNAVTLVPKQSAELLRRFTKAGMLE